MADLPGNRLQNSVSVPSPFSKIEPCQDGIVVEGVDIRWNTGAGTCLFSNMPVAMLWVDSTLAGLMSGIAAMVGPEQFSLALQSEGRKSVESDWLVIASHDDFREGFEALHSIATVAGWGNWQLITYDQAKRVCIFRAYNNWEGTYQKALGVSWGSGLLAGKFAGLCSKLFGTNCWATQTSFVAQGDAYDEFMVTPSTRSVEDEVNRLLESEQAIRADMAVALEMLRQKERLLNDQIRDRVKTEDQFRLLLETSPIAVAIFTFGDYKILFTNNQYTQLLSLKETLVSTAHPKAFFSDPTEFDLIIKRLRSDENIANILVQLSSFSGEKRWTQATFLKIKFQGMDCVLSWFYDVTEMRRARELAEETAKVKANFLANMSHEIRTPMNAIIGLSQLALSPEASVSDRVVSLEKILLASKNLLHILNDVLDFSKVEAGKVVIERTPFSLRNLVEQLQSLFLANAREKGLNFEAVVGPDAPLAVIGDSHRLSQILSNLLSNAVKFTERGKVTLKVQMKTLAASRVKVLFSVMDTGIGIPKEKLQQLFQAFSQLDASSTRRFGGSGLGLAISKKLLQLMESEFKIESVLGSGSTFSFEVWFDLPFSSEINRAGPPKSESMPDLASNGQRLRGKHILVAEDDLLNQEVVEKFLRMSGATVSLTSTGADVLALIEKRHFDAVLMDMHMPDMGGVEATRAIRKLDRFRQLPILALTAAVTSEDRDRCYSSGMNDFIPKPIDLDELVSKLTYWTSSEREDDRALSAPKDAARATRASAVTESKALGSTATVVALEGFDLTNLRRIMNDERAMIHLLKRFCNHNIDSLSQIKMAVESQQFGTAERLVHKLKGTAGNLGAMKLHSIATRLDNELKAGQCTAEAWSEFEKIFSHALGEIARLE